MGRPRDPTKAKVLRGTFRPDRAPANEPAPPVISAVSEPPAHLNAWAADMWRTLAKELTALGMLTTLDEYSLEVLCEQYGVYREMKDAITQSGKLTMAQYLATRNSQTMPEYAAMKSAFERYSALLKEFGLSPASRSRIDLPAREPAKSDPMEALLEAK